MKPHLLRPLAAMLALLCLAGSCAKDTPDPAAETPAVETEAPVTETPVSEAPVSEAEETDASEPGSAEDPAPLPASFDSPYPKGRTAAILYRITEPSSFSDRLTLASLEGLAAKNADDQILIQNGASSLFTPYIESGWGAAVTTKVDGHAVTIERLAAHYLAAGTVKGYVLCSSDEGKESASAAVSVAGLLDCAVATEKNRAMLDKAGYECLLDVTDWDDAALRASEYWEQLSRKTAFEQPVSMAPKLVDYAVMAGAYFSFYDGHRAAEHTKKYKFLDEGAIVFGYNNTLGEHDTVESFSSLNIQMVPADHAYNLSTLSGFPLAEIKQKERETPEEEPGSVHTLCVVMSDGDNIQWVLNNFATSSEWYGSSKRGRFPVGWGASPALIDTAAPMLSYLYDKMTPKDEFLMQLSGLGYTFPSRWKTAPRRQMAKDLAASMARMDIRYAEILDDGGFSENVLGDFTAQDGIDGLFYIDYSWYAGMDGKILWPNGKPAVSARYMIWADHPAGGIGYIARKLNRASTDPASEDAYSFLIVHAWSGMKDGELKPHGNTMDAVSELVSQLDSHVELVTPGVFMERLIQNCRPG